MTVKRRTIALIIGVSMLLGGRLTLTLLGYPLAVGGGQAEATGNGLSGQEMERISGIFQVMEQNYFTAIDRKKAVNGAIQGMVASIDDPYTTFMDKEQAEQFTHFVSGFFYGIGVTITTQDGQLTVISPIKGSPAEKAGIKPKDIVLSVNGEKVGSKNVNEIITKIRGPKGTTVKLGIERAGVARPIEFSITRDEVNMETIHAKMVAGQIGYIQIRQFTLNTFAQFKKQMDALESQGMKGLIIDVRHNPGGVLEVAQKMTELLVPKGKLIVQVENRHKERNQYYSQGIEQRKPYPVAVLINKGSASAAEVMASALKESAGAKLIGEATFGKGTVQEGYHLTDGGICKITIAKWLTPNGNWVHKKGIQPDMLVKQPALYHVMGPALKQNVLKFDMNDSDVKNVQVILTALGYKPGREDGYFSTGTVVAVKAFQRDNKLTATGTVNQKTAQQPTQAVVKAILDPKNDTQLHKAIDRLQQEIQ